ncbi:spore protease YyaC [Paenibacillus sp. KQZ6P-2]|uniref:Spore protease YyaC n=1 Tax=Paenibacillus mangrovi TaxID=2931978 RepID=A0A9X1WSE6_9BACL|nr:spore protease YyaC [Paenibacillus mangrovi]MCJ8014497.1 spore protease YyaC [Paenibacillus mangrovi]
MSIQDPHLIRGMGGSRKKMDAEGLHDFFMDIRSRHNQDQITFLCIGTDRSTGDALGPLTGSELCTYGFPHVIGTMASPCDASSLEARITEIPDNHIVIAIDACLGQPLSVGSYLVSDEPLFPAQSVGHALPAVGHYSVAAVVNVKGPKPYATLQMTSLYHVMTMAGQIASAAASAFGLTSKAHGDRFNSWPLT